MTAADRTLARLDEASAARRHGLAAAAQATDVLVGAARDAHAAGMPVAQIARLAGVTRATVYAWLRD